MKGHAKSSRANRRRDGQSPAGTDEALSSVPARWRWHYQTLLALRDRLMEERSERRSEASQPLERHSMDEADSATDEFDHDLALGMLSACQDALAEVDAAITRIRRGTYGRCEETGRPIAPSRLRAVPWTRFSLEAEARREREGEVLRPRLAPLGSVHPPATGQPTFETLEEASKEATDEQVERVISPPGQQSPRRARGSAGR